MLDVSLAVSPSLPFGLSLFLEGDPLARVASGGQIGLVWPVGESGVDYPAYTKTARVDDGLFREER